MIPDPSLIHVVQRQMARQFEEAPHPPRLQRPDRPDMPTIGPPRRIAARILRAVARRLEPAPATHPAG